MKTAQLLWPLHREESRSLSLTPRAKRGLTPSLASLCPQPPLKSVGKDKKLFLYKDHFKKCVMLSHKTLDAGMVGRP